MKTEIDLALEYGVHIIPVSVGAIWTTPGGLWFGTRDIPLFSLGPSARSNPESVVGVKLMQDIEAASQLFKEDIEALLTISPSVR